jgi:phenylalanine-4-hydroxylase
LVELSPARSSAAGFLLLESMSMFKDLCGDERTLRNDLHGAARDPTRPPPGAAADWTVSQDWSRFAADEHAVWDLLFERQHQALGGRAVKRFDAGLDILRLSKPGIPDFAELNERLSAETGWQVVAVPGLIPDDIFFDHLRNRRFPAGNFIRSRHQLDYIEEPDVFHDVFGHIPMLAHPVMAEWVQRLGSFGHEAIAHGSLACLGRLYWRTVEFSLASEDGELRILGAGILSSLGESAYALESDLPKRLPFDLGRVLATPYRSDAFQDLYFIVEDLDDLLRRIEGKTWSELIGAVELEEV